MASSTCMHINMGFDHDFSKKKITYQSHSQTINICTCCGFSDTKLSSKDDHFHTWNVYLGTNKNNFILKCGHFACKERIEFNPNTDDDIARYTYQNKRKYECLQKTFLETIYESD